MIRRRRTKKMLAFVLSIAVLFSNVAIPELVTKAEETLVETEDVSDVSQNAVSIGDLIPTMEENPKIVEIKALAQTEYELSEKPSLQDAIAMFPERVAVVLDNGKQMDVPVVWECRDGYELVSDRYVFTGTITDYVVEEEGEKLQICLVIADSGVTKETEMFYTLNGFSVRNTPPDVNTNTYFKYANSVYPRYPMPNCTVYVYGRLYELLGEIPKISTNSAQYVYTENKEYASSDDAYKPALGAVVCYKSGGHVQIVEEIGSDKEGKYICVSESNWSGHDDPKNAFNYKKIYLNDLATSQKDGRCKTYWLEDNDGFGDEGTVVSTFNTFQGYVYAYTEPKDEPQVSELNISLNMPSGTLTCGSVYPLSGSVQSNTKISKITASILNGKGTVYEKTVKPNKYNYPITNSELDAAMKFKELAEGEYTFRIIAQDEKKAQLLTNCFTVAIKENKVNVVEPTISLNNSHDYLDETSAERTAVLKNPGKLKISEGGMIIYDENRTAIARCSEKFNRYDTELYLYYATNNRTNVNANVTLMPGTKYYYEIYANVNNKKYTVSGDFVTKGSAKPKAPELTVLQTEYAVGDVVTVAWKPVEFAKNGYTIFLASTDGTYTKGIGTNLLEASFVLPQEGEYSISAVAKGYVDSDLAVLDKKIVARQNHRVTFVEESENGTTKVLKEEIVKHGQAAQPPIAPSRKGWAFQGWNQSFAYVTTDLVVKAKFVRNNYKVEFLDGDKGSVIKTEYVPYEGAATPPTKVTPPTGYVFTGWDSNDYTYVTENLTIKAAYVYENPNLPIQLSVNSCEFDSDGTGYTVSYNMTNFDKDVTTGRAIVSLYTSDGRLVHSTESNAFTLKKLEHRSNVEVFVPGKEAASYAEIVIMNSFKNSIPLSEKKRVNVSMTWSTWSTAAPPSGAEMQTRTVYQFCDKYFDTGDSPSKSGWTYDYAEGYWGSYGAWSAWSKNQYYSSDSRQIETRTVTDVAGYTEQEYYFYKYYKSGTGWMYSYANRSGNAGVSNVEFKNVYIKSSGDSRNMKLDHIDDGYGCYKCEPYQYYPVEWFYKGVNSRTIPAVTHTEWRCRDREYKYLYHFYKWGEWSGWSTTPVTASATRQVRSQVEYRYKTSAVVTPAWTGQKYTFGGSIGTTLGNRQALLVVYKGADVADYTIEYVGQTQVAADGSYSFTFYTREIPSVETGDFTVKLGVEGAKELLYVGTIAAPKPVYKVRYIDWDGSVIDEQEIVEGASAKLPDNPTREGYVFRGWNTGITNIHDNIDIGAVYEKEQCTVVFVDWSTEKILKQTYDVGADIIYPVWQDIEGYEFCGWFDENENEVVKAQKNLVLTAKYQVKEFTVSFYDQYGELLVQETVPYGEMVVPPEAPVIEGQRFACWSNYEYSNVKSDLNIYASYEYYETTPNPIANIKSCALETPIQVELSCELDNSTIYYTLDGTEPDFYSYEYTEPIVVDKTTVLKFVAKSDNKNDSTVITEAYLMMNAEDDSGALTIKKDKLNLVLGETAPQITYFLYHENPNIEVEFYTLDDSVVSVDQSGQLTVNNVGETQVFVVTSDYRYADYCDITVTSNEVPIESLAITEKKVSLYVGDEKDLDTRITPNNATYQDVIWSSDDEDVVSVDAAGHLVAENPGKTYIQAISHSGASVAYCYVSVENTTIGISDQEITLAAGQVHQLVAESKGYAQTFTWQSNNPQVAVVSDDGTVEAISGGTATILVTAQNGDYKTCVVRVTAGLIPADKPDAPTLRAITDNSITVNMQSGCEFSMDAVSWQDDNSFYNLLPGTRYKVYARMKATDSYAESVVSDALVVYTKENGTHNITYVMGGGVNSSKNPTVAYTTLPQTIKLQKPTRAGYKFAGWTDDYMKKITSIKKGINESVTVYANWTPIKYSIKYSLNGGTKIAGMPTSYTVESDTYVLPNLERKGYVFTGWYTDKACTKQISTIKKGSMGNVTLYAGWEVIVYDIMYEMNVGDALFINLNPDTYTVKKAVTLKKALCGGKTFQGWYSDPECTKKVTKIKSGSTGDLVLYAKWK